MNLKKTVKSLNEVDEKFHDLYKESDEGFSLIINVESGTSEDTTGLKNKNRQLLTKLNDQKAALKEYKRKESELEEKRMIENNEFDAFKESLTKKYEGEINRYKEKVESLNDIIKGSMISEQVALVGGKLFGEDAEIFKAIIESRFHAHELSEGGYQIQIKDANGHPNPNMTAEHLIDELKADSKLSKFIVGRQSTGSGANPSANSGVGGGEAEFEKYFTPHDPLFSPMRQAELADRDPEMAKRLRDKHLSVSSLYQVKQVSKHNR